MLVKGATDGYYIEKPRVVGIAQLTQLGVHDGGKIPGPKVEGFLPPLPTEWWVNCPIMTTHIVLILSHNLHV